MTLDEYQQAAKRTMNPALSFEETSRHALHGMCAELGEVHGFAAVRSQHRAEGDV